MRSIKISIFAALVLSASAFAIEDVKVSGSANLFYQTEDATSDLFDKDSSTADSSIYVNASAMLLENVKGNLSYTGVSSLGLENNFVGGVWGGSHGATTGTGQSFPNSLGGVKVENASWFNEAWIATSISKSTAKLGRMELSTPLAFTEDHSIERNSFEAAVMLNKDLPNTTMVFAYIGNGNGNEVFGDASATGALKSLGFTSAAVVNEDGDFTTFGTDGAYTAGIINSSYSPLTFQAWYYDLSKLAKAIWVQADVATHRGFLFGAQYSTIDLEGGYDSNVYAIMVGIGKEDTASIKLAYSSVDSAGAAGFNTATSTGRSNLYTEASWNYGYVSAADTSSYKISADVDASGASLGISYTVADSSGPDMSEIALGATTHYGPLETTLAYIITDADDQNSGSSFNTIQTRLTLRF